MAPLCPVWLALLGFAAAAVVSADDTCDAADTNCDNKRGTRLLDEPVEPLDWTATGMP